MKILRSSHRKASGIALCLLPLDGKGEVKSKLPAHIAHEQRALGELLEFDVRHEVKRRKGSAALDATLFLPHPGQSKLQAVVVGFFDGEPSGKLLRAMGAAAQKACRQFGTQEIFVFQSVFSTAPEKDAKLLLESVLLSDYRFEQYKSKKSTSERRLAFSVSFDDSKKLDVSSLKSVPDIVAGVCLARDLVNTPAMDLAPRQIGSVAKSIARKAGVTARVFGKAQLVQKKMNGILSVGMASAEPPAFVTLKYDPKKRISSSTPVVGLIGKGVTFDSGGLSIKTGAGMETMKCDMAGAAAVLGTFHALASLQLPIKVRGYIPTAENMIQGNALRPGDVIRMMSGKTVEVLNTDAEGRLILADALHYASNDGCDILIDLATLTGACVVALGEKYSAVYSNDSELGEQILEASSLAHEGCWPMPLVEEYKENLKSDIADIKNVGARGGGSITAALFLQYFVGEQVKWAHMDIAGPAFASSADGPVPKGGTGVGVRTLLHYLEGLVS